MLKRKKVVKGGLIDPSPSKAFDEEAARFSRRYQDLLLDVNDMTRDIQLKKKKLKEEKRRKLTLSAEIRFLRRKYEELIQNQSLKSPLVKPNRLQAPKIRREAVVKPSPKAILDLNLISNGDEEEGREFPFALEPPRVENYSKYTIGRNDEEQRPNLKGTICRNGRSGSSRTGKRKISLQDQVVVRV